MAEATGRWPDAVDAVLIVLLPRADGGRRPISLFASVVRLWMRARIYMARQWEAKHPNTALYGSKGMGAQRAAWTAAAGAEAAKLAKKAHAQALLDLVKAFEKVLHQKLIDAAADKHYPMTTLRLSLAAYRLARSVGNEGIYSRLIRTSQGIIAGSGIATSELRVLLIGMIEAIQATWPTEQGISVMLYVDDITISATGDPEVIR